MNKKLPSVWCILYDVTILDPDGWDRSNYEEDWAKPLTQQEFEAKMNMSTILPGPMYRRTS